MVEVELSPYRACGIGFRLGDFSKDGCGVVGNGQVKVVDFERAGKAFDPGLQFPLELEHHILNHHFADVHEQL